MKKKVFTKEWFKAAGIRALKTTAQAGLWSIKWTSKIMKNKYFLFY